MPAIGSITLEDIPGHVDAWPELTIEGSADFDSIEVGVQPDFDPDNPEALLANLASGLTVTGFGGASSTRSGSYSTNTALATLTATPVVVCATSGLTHKDHWKISARCYGSTAAIKVRLAWKVGDGPVTREPWVDLPGAADWYDLSLQTINISELPSGHSWTGYIEAVSTSGTPTIDVDFMDFMPGVRWGRAHAPLVNGGFDSFPVRDDFTQVVSGGSDPLTGLTLPSGGTWAGAGDSDDFVVEDTGHTAKRQLSTADANINTGRYAIAGSTSFTDTIVQADIKGTQKSTELSDLAGCLARYTDTNNWLIAGRTGTSGAGTQEQCKYTVRQRVSGTVTVLSTSDAFAVDRAASYTLRFVVRATGAYFVWAFIAGQGQTLVTSGYSAALATGGALASGKTGIYHANIGSTVGYDATFDNFLASNSTANAVLFAGQSARVTHEAAYRENAAGTSEGKVPAFNGKYPTIPPATRAGRKSRLVVKARQFDGASGLPDRGLDESLSLNLDLTPRVVLVGQGSTGS